MKKLLLIILAAALITLSSAPVLAHGSNHGAKKAAAYSVCSIKSCMRTGTHTHSGRAYYAHYYDDGHKYHEYCAIEACSLAGYHSHDKTYCFGHTAGDGHSYQHAAKGHH